MFQHSALEFLGGRNNNSQQCEVKFERKIDKNKDFFPYFSPVLDFKFYYARNADC